MLELLRLRTDEVRDLLRERGYTEIAQIDHDPDLGLTWSYPKRGVEIRFERERVTTIFLFGVPAEDYQPYADAPFPEIEWTSSFEHVQEVLGPPSRVSEGNPNSQFGPIPPWLRYDQDKFSVHFEFLDDKARIGKVTFMSEAP